MNGLLGFIAGILFTFALYEYVGSREYNCLEAKAAEFFSGTDWRGRKLP